MKLLRIVHRSLSMLLWGIFLITGADALELGEGDQAVLYADRFESKGDLVTARGHVALSHDGTLLLADEARYDRNRRVVDLNGSVEIFARTGNRVFADSVAVDLGRKRVLFRNFYETDDEDVWVLADRAVKEEGNYTLSNSVASSCSVRDPDWSVHFDRARYDATRKELELKDVTFYARKTPVLYLPYLPLSLDRRRRSGFLMPHLGIGGDEGFRYAQPYYWAISPSRDLELVPQIRTRRGEGGYLTYRFADSPYSKGVLRTGYFRDRDGYVRRHHLKNGRHYGLEFHYESDHILGARLPEGYREGFYADWQLFDDIDYLNLQHDRLDHLQETSHYRESRINYFLYDDRYYFGAGGRYFIDTAAGDNRQTVQELPNLQFHRFVRHFGNGHFNYSFDAGMRSFFREEGSYALQGDFSLPLEYHQPLMGDYLVLTLKEELAGSETDFSKKIGGGHHYEALMARHELRLGSDLIRRYDSGVHTLMFSASYTHTTLLQEGRVHYESLPATIRGDYNLPSFSKARFLFGLHQFWNGENGLNIDSYLSASYYPGKATPWENLRHELDLRMGAWHFSSLLDYSLERRGLTEASHTLEYLGKRYAFKTDYLWKKDLQSYLVTQREFSAEFRYRQNESLTWYGGVTYDLLRHHSKNWKVGLLLDRKCWNMQLSFRQETIPILTRQGGGSIHNNAVRFHFNLIPFGGTGLDKDML